jgi:phage terminase large subunit-like protein
MVINNLSNMIQTKSPLLHYKTVEEYQNFLRRLKERHNQNKLIKDPIEREEAFKEEIRFKRLLLRTDLFFLLWYGCNKHYIAKQWLLDRCKEVEAEPNGYIDLWSREHFKSTIITYGKSIQDIIASHGDDPLLEWERETTIGILSVTRPLAKSFLREIKVTFENPQLPLTQLFPDVFHKNPKGQSSKWSEDEGIVVKRKSSPKESTVEAWGLVDAQPTGKHFYTIVYDDIVTQDTVTTPEMIQKTTQAWGLSDNIGTRGGIYRAVGTPYAANDTTQAIIDSGTFKLRKYPATIGSKYPIESDDEAYLLTKAQLDEKYKKQGVYNFACQILLNPTSQSLQNFKFEWLKYYGGYNPEQNLNIYIIVDPAHSKKKESDYTAMFAVGAGEDGNYYVIDMIRDRLNLKERTDKLFKLVNKYKPICVGYEQYGMQSDIEHIKEKQEQLRYHFQILPLGGKLSKQDRIAKLIPDFQNSKIFLPYELHYIDYENKKQDLTKVFVDEEYLTFPTPKHDDMLDCLARIKDQDLMVTFPLKDEWTDYEEWDDSVNDRDSVTGY